MEIQRQDYLNKLVSKRENGRIKIITGLRRSGKSYLLFETYFRYLLQQGVDRERIVTLANTFASVKKIQIQPATINCYLS